MSHQSLKRRLTTRRTMFYDIVEKTPRLSSSTFFFQVLIHAVYSQQGIIHGCDDELLPNTHTVKTDVIDNCTSVDDCPT